MTNEDRYGVDLEPFSVSDDLLNRIREDSEIIDEIDESQGHQISGVGDVYTPPEIVTFILDSVGYVAEKRIEDVCIADLACGSGSFIVAIVKRLRERLIRVGYNPEDPDGARQILSTIKNNVCAVDENSVAVWKTAQLVINELSTEIEAVSPANPIERLPIYHSNALLPRSELEQRSFDVIVGNPPYRQNEDIDSELNDIYRKDFKTAEGKYDLYSLYFEKAISLLLEGGNLGYVTPNRFHRTNYGKPLRKLLVSKSNIKGIVNLADKPFSNVNVYPTITFLEVTNSEFPNYQLDTDFVFCDVDSADLTRLNDVLDERFEASSSRMCSLYSQTALESSSWQFVPPQVKTVTEKIEDRLLSIENSPIRIKTGIATGADDVFVLNPEDAQRIEDELLYPLIRGKDVGKGEIESHNQFILNPYDRNGTPIELDRFPSAKAYLERHREKLESRYCVREGNKRWYETHDTIDITSEGRRKIVTPDITLGARFAITEGSVCHNTCYSFYYGGNIDCLLAYFNSNVFEFLLKSAMPKMDSGYWRQMKRDLKNLPVIAPGRIDRNTEDRLARYGKKKEWGNVNEELSNLLELTDEDADVIAEYLTS